MREVNSMEASAKALLQQSSGQLLRSVEGLFFVSLGESCSSWDNLDQLRITLGSNAARFHCGSDGETLTVDGDDLRPCGLGEYGEMRRVDLSKESMFASHMKKSLRQTFLIKSHEGHSDIGFLLEFDAGLLVICNWGDDLKVWDKIPEPLFADEGIPIKLS